MIRDKISFVLAIWCAMFFVLDIILQKDAITTGVALFATIINGISAFED